MLGIIITAAIIWFVCKVASAAFENAKEERKQKQIMRIQAEQFRQEEKIRLARLEARQAMTKQLEYERDQFLLKKEVDRVAEEQRKQAEQLAKHEKRIATLEVKVEKSNRIIESCNERLSDLYALLDIEEMEYAACVSGSKEQTKHFKKIATLKNQIRSAEEKKESAKDSRKLARKELAA